MLTLTPPEQKLGDMSHKGAEANDSSSSACSALGSAVQGVLTKLVIDDAAALSFLRAVDQFRCGLTGQLCFTTSSRRIGRGSLNPTPDLSSSTPARPSEFSRCLPDGLLRPIHGAGFGPCEINENRICLGQVERNGPCSMQIFLARMHHTVGPLRPRG